MISTVLQEPVLRVVTFGEALGLIRGNGVGGFDQLGSAALSVGGAQLNVAIALARLGARVQWAGRIGDDPFGRRIVRELRAEGVEVVTAIDDGRTALMLKETLPLGKTRVTFYRDDSAGSRLRSTDLEHLDIENADVLHLTGIVLGLSDTARSAALYAVRRARAAGIRVSFDINHRPSLWRDRPSGSIYRDVVAASDVVFGSRDELELVVASAGSDEALARGIAALGPAEVVVKQGGDGAGVLAGDAWLEASALSVDVVDTVGAGDLFVAGYLSFQGPGALMIERIEGAIVNGAAACTHPGDWEGALAGLSGHRESDPVVR